MDGYALRSADTAGAPVTLRIVGQIAAGVNPQRAIGLGETMQINTGAPVPSGADAVVRVEETEQSADGRSVLVRKSAEPAQFITTRATHAKAGETVLTPGMFITPAEIGVAAGAGAANLMVHRVPTVSILSTGNELVDVNVRPEGAQIRNSNGYQLEALVRAAHADSIVVGVARDDPAELRGATNLALQSDICCITGGVSMGEFDFVPQVLMQCGVTVRFRKMAIKPGRPVIFGTTTQGSLVFALPGNPVSSFLGFELLVRPAIAALQGRRDEFPKYFRARLDGYLPPTADRRTFFPATAGVGNDGTWSATPLRWHGSGDAFGLAGANAMIMRPPFSAAAKEGDLEFLMMLGLTRGTKV
jgi:molybdopterin molybdotransferase